MAIFGRGPAQGTFDMVRKPVILMLLAQSYFKHGGVIEEPGLLLQEFRSYFDSDAVDHFEALGFRVPLEIAGRIIEECDQSVIGHIVSQSIGQGTKIVCRKTE